MKKFSLIAITTLSFWSPLRAQEVSKQDSLPANMTAVDVMKNHVAAIGGENAIRGIKDIKVTTRGILVLGDKPNVIVMTEMKKAPAKLKTRGSSLGMESGVVFNGVRGYYEAQEVKLNFDGEMLESMKQKADMYAILDREKYGDKITLKRIDNGAYVIEIKDPAGKKSVEYYDTKTGYLIKEIKYTGDLGEAITEYSDYREVPEGNGYKIPYTVKTSIMGHVVPTKVETVEVNKGISDAEFE